MIKEKIYIIRKDQDNFNVFNKYEIDEQIYLVSEAQFDTLEKAMEKYSTATFENS
jgi:hypothetical protein